MTREKRQVYGEQLKKRIAVLADDTDKFGRLKIKISLMEGGASETTARLLMNGEYDRKPRQDLIENMEGVLAKFGRAKAS